jgi:lysophospholipase L1-like esterase
VINRGFGGSTLPDCIHFFDRLVLPYKPSTIVFYEGDNDIGRGDTARTVYEHFKTFAAMVKKQLPGTRLIFIAIKPSIKRWDRAPEMKKANRMIQHYVWLNNDLGFADIWDPMLGEDGKPRPELFLEDGLHMTPKGYEIWTRIVAAEL